MSTEPDSKLRPVLLVKTGSLSTTAIHELRAAGYTVVQAAVPEGVKQFYPESFLCASAKAKMAAFDFAISDSQVSNNLSKSQLLFWYIFYLREAKAF